MYSLVRPSRPSRPTRPALRTMYALVRVRTLDRLLSGSTYLAFGLLLALGATLIMRFTACVGPSGFDPSLDPLYLLVYGTIESTSGISFASSLFAAGPVTAAVVISTMGLIIWLLVTSSALLGTEYRTGSLDLTVSGPVSDTQVVISVWLDDLLWILIWALLQLVTYGTLAGVLNLSLPAAPLLLLLACVLFAGAMAALGLLMTVLTQGSTYTPILVIFLIAAVLALDIYLFTGRESLAGGIGPFVRILDLITPAGLFRALLTAASRSHIIAALLSGIGLGVSALMSLTMASRIAGYRRSI